MNDDAMMRYFYQIFEKAPRQGPGSPEATARAFGLCAGLPPAPEVLDVGCGTGAQTLELARLTGGTITAVDSHAPFLARLDALARAAGLSGRVRTVQADMADLVFPAGSFDLVWSEGAIYNMGFEAGLKAWRDLLRPGGCLAVSDLVWLKAEVPAECEGFWGAEAPGVTTVSQRLSQAAALGYDVLGHFTISPECWTAAYYDPLEQSLDALITGNPGDPDAERVVSMMRQEARMYLQFKDFCGYEFFVLRRP
jgi:SAM-dependent methyltransferase